MSIQRRIETRTDTMVIGGKRVTYTYNVEIALDSVPAPFQYDDENGLDNTGGRSPVCTPTLGTFVAGQGWVANDPRPEPTTRRPKRSRRTAAGFGRLACSPASSTSGDGCTVPSGTTN
jgi:hypothetical protein